MHIAFKEMVVPNKHSIVIIFMWSYVKIALRLFVMCDVMQRAFLCWHKMVVWIFKPIANSNEMPLWVALAWSWTMSMTKIGEPCMKRVHQPVLFLRTLIQIHAVKEPKWPLDKVISWWNYNHCHGWLCLCAFGTWPCVWPWMVCRATSAFVTSND